MYRDGPYTVAELADRGIGVREAARLAREGRLSRVRPGWYADAFSAPEAVRAVELGGRLGCLSASHLHGLWVPRHADLHVVVNPGARLPAVHPERVQFHRLARACPGSVAGVGEAVAQVLHRHDMESALVVLESAVNGGQLDEAEARHLLAHAPHRSRRAAQYFSPGAQSGSETRVRLFFQRNRVPVQSQVFIPGVGRVDLLVGRSWIIEADSAAHHSSPRDVAVDTGRDLHARELGYDRDRLSFEQIWDTWDSTQDFLLARLRTRRHLRPPVPLRR